MSALADLFGTRYLFGQGGIDFASIRLHDAGADRACRALHARVFTTGSDIYFADGAFAPHTRAGLWLLAHEVARWRTTTWPGSTPCSVTSPRRSCRP